MSKGIYMKLLRLMEAVDHIEKRGRNKAQNYDYLMAEDVINEVRQECIKEKLVIIPAATGQNVITSENKSGGTMFLTTVPMTFTICDAETGESITVPWEGQGQDSGDKGIYKAFTGADKYFLRNLLLIPTGDDPENDGGQPKPRQQQTRTAPASTPIPTPQMTQSLGAPLQPNLVEQAEKVFPPGTVVDADAQQNDKSKGKDEPHKNKNKSTEAITRTIAIAASNKGVEVHEEASKFYKRPIISLYDIGEKSLDYQPFLQHLNSLPNKG